MDSQPFKRLFFFVAIVVLMSFNHVSDYLNEMRIGRRIDTWLWFKLAHQRTVAFVLVDFQEEILGGKLILKRR